MKIIFCISVFFVVFFANAQDTTYLNSTYEKTVAEEAVFYRIDKRPASGEVIDLVRTTYWTNRQIQSQRSYSEKDRKLTLEGLQKTWYENGQLFYSEFYKNGKRNGELLAYWEDGTKRRHDIYKKGKLKSGKLWDKKGVEIEHFPVMIPAEFPGGKKGIDEYLKANLPVPETQKQGTEVRMLVKLRINKEGYLDKIDIVEGAPHWYNAVTTNTLTNMPKWAPGKFMGEPVNVWFTLPIIFRK